MDRLYWQKSSVRLLGLFNAILLGISWVMMIKAYPRLPQLIPYWLNLAGQSVLRAPKGPLFFIYPAAQTLFLVVFWLAGNIWVRKQEPDEDVANLASGLEKSESHENNQGLFGQAQAEDQKSGTQSRVSGESGQPAAMGTDFNYAVGKKAASWNKRQFSPELLAAITNLKKELVLLLMIFFNLIFIHIQRSLIWLAHGPSAGVNKFYFFSLIIIILLLIPYYRFRRTLIKRGHL
ncbi:MAG: hypothetical protein ACUVRL_08435 [Candidatus Saccharicenans sp.]|uniref:hypothetical protein n=1 Tax=Candidatus Saccharicenans sp. TaxID=2819258 RepID=UPI00404A3ABD